MVFPEKLESLSFLYPFSPVCKNMCGYDPIQAPASVSAQDGREHCKPRMCGTLLFSTQLCLYHPNLVARHL